MTRKVTDAQYYKMQKLIAQLQSLRDNLPEESDARMQMGPAIEHLVRAFEMLKDEMNAGR